MVGLQKMRLVDVYAVDSSKVLYELLKERPANANISHTAMPSWMAHIFFVSKMPYAAWYLIMASETSPEVLGSIYLTKANEIGIFIFKRHQGMGHAGGAIKELMRLHPRERYLANIAPSNQPSLGLFKHLGFEKIQETYEFHA